MKRNLKALGLALLAAFAMSAVAASAAQATQAQFTASEYPVVGTGTQEGGPAASYFETTPGRKMHCSNATYEGQLTAPSTSITVTPHYTNCKSTVGGVEVGTSVDLNGCHFLLFAGTKKSGGSTGSGQLKCPAGSSATVTIATCTIHIPEQSIGGAAGEITFTNKASGDIHIDIDVTNQVTAQETDGFLCPFEGETHVTNGSLVCTITIGIFRRTGTHHGVTVDPDGSEHTLEIGTEGSAVNADVG